MKIKRLSLTNFRSFKETQTIDFAPVTLLFGPNSVGKSTVLMALAYIQHILNEGCNPEYLTVLGEKHVGGFASLINGGDLDKSIILKLEIDDQPSFGSYHDTEVGRMINRDAIPFLLIDFPDTDTGENCAFEIEIAWSKINKTAYVKVYRVWIDGEYLGCIESKPNMNNVYLTELNEDHPKLQTYDDFWDLANWLDRLNQNRTVPAKEADEQRAGQSVRSSIKPVGVSMTKSGAVPLFKERLELDLYLGEEEYENEEILTSLLIDEQLSKMFNTCLIHTYLYLNQSVFIGPIRTVPDANFQANADYRQRDWFDGRTAWDILYDNQVEKNRLLDKVSSCLADEDKLNTGYSLYKTSLLDNLSEVDIEGLPRPILHDLNQAKIFFKESASGNLLNPSQLGIGISQLLPIVVATCKENIGYLGGGILSIEQPELHIHPRLQTQLGDLLVEAALRSADAKLNIIETHSEHLILRLLKRIRQTTDGELPEGMCEVKNSDVSIVYIEPSDTGVKARRINIDEDGEFKERWPQGFFTERREELM